MLRLAVVVALALALALGASHASPAVAAETLTHGQLVDRAFAICASASDGIARVRPALTFAQSADALADVLVHLRRATATLAGLRPNASDAPRLDRYVRLMRRQITALQRAQRAAGRGDRPAFRAAYLDAGAVSLQARRAATRLGLTVCSTL
jgi:hypothetical protein